MLIKLDCRETKLLPLCTAYLSDQSSIQIVSESLPLGDAIIYENTGEYKEKVIIERKSLADLAASIRDGRYAEQSYRLTQSTLHNHHVYYVIEGDLRYYRPFKGMPDKKTLLSAMVSISYFKGFSLYRTNSLEETAEWIVQFAAKLEKEGHKALPYYAASDPASDPTTAPYSEVIAKRVKKDNITPENIGEIMLSQIPNVSNASAIAIMTKFHTVADLLMAIKSDTHCLDDIRITNKNGQSKRLMKPCINAIYTFLGNSPTITLSAS
jgi:ERCC4-type nuclease